MAFWGPSRAFATGDLPPQPRSPSAVSSRDGSGLPDAEIRKATTSLLIDDAKKIRAQSLRAAPASSAMAVVITLDPYVVQSAKIPVVILPRYEPPLLHFLRAGTLLEIVGRNVTTQVKVEVGRDPAGFAKPSLGLHFAW